jgi:hypothetical protein
MYVWMHVCNVCMYVSMYVCMYVCMYVYMYALVGSGWLKGFIHIRLVDAQ